MSFPEKGYSVLFPALQHWRESNLMRIPNANLLQDLGDTTRMGGRLWRLPPNFANTWHRHVASWEFYFVLEGVGRIRVGRESLTVPRYGSVLVAPQAMRQVFNDTQEDSLWLIIAAPQEGQAGERTSPTDFYPEDPRSLPPELSGRAWPPG